MRVPDRDTIPVPDRKEEKRKKNAVSVPQSAAGRRREGQGRTDLSGLVNVTRHNTDLACTGLDDTGAVRANQAGLFLLHQRALDLRRRTEARRVSRALLVGDLHGGSSPTLTMSCWGIPSVMHTTNSISASMASMMALAA